MSELRSQPFELELRHACRALKRADLCIATIEAAERAIALAAASMAVCAPLTALAWAGQISLACPVAGLSAASLAGLMMVGGGLARAAFGRPSLARVAERLDLAMPDTHNRVATALEFAGRDAVDPFERAAIRDGLAWLAEHRDVAPKLPTRAIRVARDAALLAIAALLVAAVASWPIARRAGLAAGPFAADARGAPTFGASIVPPPPATPHEAPMPNPTSGSQPAGRSSVPSAGVKASAVAAADGSRAVAGG